VYFYLNQLEPKLALTAFLSTAEAGVLVGVNYYRTTDFLSQHLKKKKKEGVKRLLLCLQCSKLKKQIFRLYVVFVPLEYCVYLCDFSTFSQRHHYFFPTQISVVPFFQAEQLLAHIRHPRSKLQNYL